VASPEEEKARRTARAIVSDIKLYNQKKLAGGGDARAVLKSEIAEGLDLYNSRVDPKVRALGPFFEDAIDQMLLGKAPGASAPAPAAKPAPAPAPAPAPKPVPAPAPKPAPVSQEAEDRQVFEQVIASRKKCGEAVGGQDFARFAQMLSKARADLIQKYGCASVRFEVYVKDGKTAVKPVPVGGKAPRPG
jgi:hypothetical protein